MMLGDKYANHDNINESSLNSSHLVREDNNAENNIQSNEQIDTAFNSDKPYVVPKQKPDNPTIAKNEIKYDGLRSWRSLLTDLVNTHVIFVFRHGKHLAY